MKIFKRIQEGEPASSAFIGYKAHSKYFMLSVRIFSLMFMLHLFGKNNSNDAEIQISVFLLK